MTDKKYEELLKCAAEFIDMLLYDYRRIENPIKGTRYCWDAKEVDKFMHPIMHSHELQALKACLPPPPPPPPPPPSRLEIADKLEAHAFSNLDDVQKTIDAAIAELRK